MNAEEKSRYFQELTLNLRHKGLTVKQETKDGLLPVELDSQRLCQVTDNGGIRYWRGCGRRRQKHNPGQSERQGFFALNFHQWNKRYKYGFFSNWRGLNPRGTQVPVVPFLAEQNSKRAPSFAQFYNSTFQALANGQRTKCQRLFSYKFRNSEQEGRKCLQTRKTIISKS